MWGKPGVPGDIQLAGVQDYFAQADFRQDIHFDVNISAGHKGTETWPTSCARMRFHLPADQMDAWVRDFVEGRETLARRQKAQQRAG